jgi:hypothetical protein
MFRIGTEAIALLLKPDDGLMETITKKDFQYRH